MGIKIFASCQCRLSESPMWNDRDKMLYWRGLDGEIFRKREDAPHNEYERFELGVGNIGSMVFTDTDIILLFGDDGKVWKWIPHTQPILYRDFKGSLFNDVLCDGKGRIYCGMLAKNYFYPQKREKYGSLWLFDVDGSFRCLEDKLSATPNGIRINPKQDKLYFAVTDDGCVYCYDYDRETGELSNRKIFAEKCCPDGIALDNDENVWVTDCRPNDSKLICFAKNGARIREWKFPVRRITSVAFGGEDKKTIFITTAHEGQPKGVYDGGVFMMRTDIAGAKEYSYLHLGK